jgi:hypothetical protein
LEIYTLMSTSAEQGLQSDIARPVHNVDDVYALVKEETLGMSLHGNHEEVVERA